MQCWGTYRNEVAPQNCTSTLQMQHHTCQHRPVAVLAVRSPLPSYLQVRRHVGAVQRTAGPLRTPCRRRHAPRISSASLSAATWPDEDVEVTTERRTAPPKLPAPPKGSSLIAVMPYLVKLATSDRCASLPCSLSLIESNSGAVHAFCVNACVLAPGACGGGWAAQWPSCWCPSPQARSLSSK